jgi:hypothetical protein
MQFSQPLHLKHGLTAIFFIVQENSLFGGQAPVAYKSFTPSTKFI